MRIRFLVAAAALWPAACGPAAETGTASLISSPMPAVSPAEVVSQLYDAALNAPLDAPGGPLIVPDQRARFFAPDLATALSAEYDLVAAERSVSLLDISSPGAGADPSAGSLRIAPGPLTAMRAEVSVRIGSQDEPIRLDYVLTRTNAGWRVADIREPGADGWSLRETLSLQPAS